MNSPRALILSIAATAASFVLALVGVIASASGGSAPVAEVALVPDSIAIMAHDVRPGDSVLFTVEVASVANQIQTQIR